MGRSLASGQSSDRRKAIERPSMQAMARLEAMPTEPRVVMLGTGGPDPDGERHASCAAVIAGEAVLLVDAGGGAAHQLARAGIRPAAVDRILVTHLHYDHIGGLGDLLLASWTGGRTRPVEVTGPPGTEAILAALLDAVFAPDIRWRLAESACWTTMDGAAAPPALQDPASLLRASESTGGRIGAPEGWTIRAVETDHGRTMFGLPDWHSLAFRVELGGRSIVFTGDTARTDELTALASGADTLVATVGLPAGRLQGPFLEAFGRRVIASAAEVGRLAADASVGRLVATHVPARASRPAIEADIRRAYRGEIVFACDELVLSL